VNLSKGLVGEGNASLLGSMLVTKIYLASMSRADVAESELKKLPNFYLYVDEFQSFANESFADILSEARKYKLNLTIAHQYIEQMSEEVRAAVFGNVGTLIAFRVGSFDAEVLEKEFAPVFTSQDIVNLSFAQIYLRLMIDNIGSRPFSAKTIPPLEKNPETFVTEIKNNSREKYAHIRSEVEEIVRQRQSSDARPEKSSPKLEKAQTFNKPKLNNERYEKREKVISKPKNSQFAEKIKEAVASQPQKPNPQIETVSLQNMTTHTQRTIMKKDTKSASPTNTNALKEALAGVLIGNSQNILNQTNPEEETSNKKNTEPNNNFSMPPEISEKELREILEI
jgi:hypothetical protein